VAWLALAACSCSSNGNAKDQLLHNIGARVDPHVQLVANRKQFKLPHSIVYEIVNQRATPVCFEDDSFGLRIYRYDASSQQWIRLPQPYATHPDITCVKPAPSQGIENTGVIGLNRISVTGMVRLVVIGWTDPSNPEGSKIAAYADIEIVR
jgi:hypothetical protein